MQKLTATCIVFFLALSAARADDFIADVKKVAGDQITLARFAPSKGGKEVKKTDVTLTVAESCKVTRRELDVKTRKTTIEPVEGGLKNDVFKKSLVTARIRTEEGKVTAIEVIAARPKYELLAAVTKVDGNKITVKKLGTLGEQSVLSTVEQVKVVKAVRPTGGKFEAGEAIVGGLKNEMFARGKARAILIVDDNNVVTEVRVLPGPYFPGGGPPGVQPELRRVVDHGDMSAIVCVAFSPDGKLIVTGENGYRGAADKTMRLWETASGREIRSTDVQLNLSTWLNTQILRSVAFSPDGSLILAGTETGHIHLWDVASGKKISQRLLGNTKDPLGIHAALAVGFSPDGSEILAGSAAGVFMRLDPVSEGSRMVKFGPTSCMAFSADGKHAATCDNKTVRLWDLTTEKQIRSIMHQGSYPSSIAFSHDGKQVLMADDKNTVRLWDAGSGELVQTVKGNRAAFARDGKYVATAGPDNIIRLWDIGSGKEIRRFEGHTRTILALAFSPDGKMLLSGGDDFGARLWDVAGGKEIRRFQRQLTPIYAAAVSNDGKQLLVGGGDAVARVWDLAAGRQMGTFQGHAAAAILPIRSVAFSPDGKQAVSANGSTTARLWDVAGGKEILRFEHGFAISGVAFVEGSKQVCTIGVGGAKIWDAASGKALRTIGVNVNLGHAHAFALSADGNHLLTPTDFGLSVLWDLAKGKNVFNLKGHTGNVNAVALSPDGKHALTGGEDKTARLWDLATGKEIRKFSGHTSPVVSVAMSPDGKHVLTGGSWDNTARLWDAASGDLIHTLAGPPRMKGGQMHAVAFLADGSRLLTASQDGILRLWDAKTGNELCQLFSFTDGTWAVIDAQGRFDGPDKGNVQWIYYRVDRDIVPLQQLHSGYHDPGLLAKYLGHNKEPLRDVKNWKDLGVFPAVEATATRAGDMKLAIDLTNRGGGIGKVQVFVDGKECIADARPASFDANVAGATLTMDLAGLVPAGSRIRIVAWNAEGSLSHAGLELEP